MSTQKVKSNRVMIGTGALDANSLGVSIACCS